jgi:uncharacterized membrane protein YhaH (DUF805 family)
MLSNILGFGGRIGRLEYFLLCLALGFATVLVVFAMAFGTMPRGGAGGVAPHHVPTALILMLVVFVLPVYLWFAFAFQAKRIRDIGWNPLYVILGWIAVIALDRAVAMIVPTVALGSGGGTLVGGLINLAMCGILLFWPSAPADSAWSEQVYHTAPPTPPAPRPAPRAAAPAPGWTPAPAPTGFGRRGL